MDLLVGSHPETWTLGEAQLLPYELWEERSPCGCGRPIQECSFWSSVIDRIPIGQGDYPIEHFREEYGSGETLRLRSALSMVTEGSNSLEKRKAERYGTVNKKYFRAVIEEAESRYGSISWLVDASKDAYRLYWLYLSNLFDIYVFHLTKDPRAYVYSIARRQKTFGYKNIARWAGRWLVDNAIKNRLLTKSFGNNSGMQVKYKKIASTPTSVIQKLTNTKKLSLKSINNGAKNSIIRSYTNHAVSGNEMRWKGTNIYLDDKWKVEMKKSHKDLVWNICKYLARRFGYRKKDETR